MHLHGEVDILHRLRAEVSRLGRDVEMITASLIDTANMRNEVVERAGSLSAQLAAPICRGDTCRSEITNVKEDLVKTRV